jgi:DNA repair protein RecN (Recombination protein N)
MLVELEIKDFALVEHVCVPFTPGLNVLTGETGAGKSILMDALNAVLGGKVGSSVIRPQTERATVEATFNTSPDLLAFLKEHELADQEDDTFNLSREISRNGSKMRINGSLVNLGLVQDLRQRLVTIHAQHESRTLLSPQSQLEMLDALGDAEHKKLLAKLKTVYARRRQLESELDEIQALESERERRLDFARFQHAELADAQLDDPEEYELTLSRRKVLANVSELESMLSQAQVYLRGEDGDGRPGVLELIQSALCEVAKASQLDERLAPVEAALNESLDRLEDECRTIRKYCESLDSDPETLAHLDERLAALSAIKRKYGPQLSDAIARREDLCLEIDRLGNARQAILELGGELDTVNAELFELAQNLSKKRTKLAQSLSRKIQTELAELGMSNCRFEIVLSRAAAQDTQELLATIGPGGLDRVEFLICPNPGQPLLPVARIASGGELSRVMLAVKTIFAAAEKEATVIFDEIDTGLSGRVLQTMRDKLARLARSQQILCVTHQPIIASVADNHVLVLKEQGKTSTRTQVSILDEDARLKALAGMASGQENQEVALSFARSLFEESLKVKNGLT